MTDNNLWNQILERIETKVNRHCYTTWFKPTLFFGQQGNTVTVAVPNALFKDWLARHYSGIISEAISDLKLGEIAVDFLADPAAEVTSAAIPAREASPEGAPEANEPAAPVGPAGLNPRYTFETF